MTKKTAVRTTVMITPARQPSNLIQASSGVHGPGAPCRSGATLPGNHSMKCYGLSLDSSEPPDAERMEETETRCTRMRTLSATFRVMTSSLIFVTSP